MHIDIIAVGKIKERYLREGIEEYLKRLGAYARVRVIEVREEPYEEPLGDAARSAVIEREGAAILRATGPRVRLVALDRQGESLSSEAVADRLNAWATGGQSAVSFAIGGSLGLSPEVLARADLCLSLSAMTFPHQLVRLLLVEQLYRAFTILRGEKYHK